MTNVRIIYCIAAVVLAPHSALQDIDWNKKMKRGVEYRTEGTKTEKWIHEWLELEGSQMWKTCNGEKEESEVAWNWSVVPLVKNISGMHNQTANKVKFNYT